MKEPTIHTITNKRHTERTTTEIHKSKTETHTKRKQAINKIKNKLIKTERQRNT